MGTEIQETSQHSTFESVIQIRPSDIDYNGHVHHSRYFDFLLLARQDQMERCYKMPMQEFAQRGYSWMVRSYDIEYKRGLTLYDQAIVKTRVMAMGDPTRNKKHRSLATIGFEILNSKRKVAALGTAVYVLVDVKTARPVEIPADVIEKYTV